MRHVITGGLGFTGRHLTAELMRRKEEVVIFDCATSASDLPTAVRVLQGDIRDLASLEAADLKSGDVVYHLAARQFHSVVPRLGRDRWFAEVNVDGTRKLLDAMEKGGARELVFFSSDMVYGFPNCSPVPTDHPRNPLGPYGRSKRDAEDLIAARMRTGIRCTIFRPRMIVGPGRLGTLSKLFRLIAAGWPVPLIGNGKNRYQMASVHDCVSAALHAVKTGLPAGPFNLGSTNPPMVKDLLNGLIEKVGSRSRLLPTPAGAAKATLALLDFAGLTLLHPEQFKIADQDYVLDLANTASVLGFTPAYDDRKMLFAAYEEYLKGAGRA